MSSLLSRLVLLGLGFVVHFVVDTSPISCDLPISMTARTQNRDRETHLDGEKLNSRDQDSIVLGIQPVRVFTDQSTKIVLVHFSLILSLSIDPSISFHTWQNSQE